MGFQEYIDHGRGRYLPSLSLDLVIIAYDQGILKCLLLKVGEKWYLPGGFIGLKESVETAVLRVLEERTALKEPHFKFLSVFGDKDRDFSEEIKGFMAEENIPWSDDLWLAKRHVTLTYYSLVNIEDLAPIPGDFDEAVAWFDFNHLPEIGMDHKAIVLTARERLREDIQREHLTYNLLPPEFTMPELHQLHETILDLKLDRSRFQKKMIASGRFERLEKRKSERRGSNPYQYRLKK